MQSHHYTTGSVSQLAAQLKVNSTPGSVTDRLADSLATIATRMPQVPTVAPSDPNLIQPGPGAYDLRISESQRHYLLVALAQCKLQGYYGADETGCEEIAALYDMLDQGLEPLGTLNDLTA